MLQISALKKVWLPLYLSCETSTIPLFSFPKKFQGSPPNPLSPPLCGIRRKIRLILATPTENILWLKKITHPYCVLQLIRLNSLKLKTINILQRNLLFSFVHIVSLCKYILVATTLCILILAIATFLVKKDQLQYDIAKIQSSQVSQLQGLSILKTVSCREMVHELCKTINKYPPTNIVH